MTSLFPLLILPLLGALGVLLTPESRPRLRHGLALAGSLLPLLWTLRLIAVAGTPGADGMLFGGRARWIPALGIDLHLGLDGIGLVFVLLTGIVTPFALAITPPELRRARAFPILMLVLQAMLFGTFTALNFMLWFLFWELTLVPAFLLIRLWGGEDRNAAALRFFLMTLAGSLAMLAAFLALFLATGTFDLTALAALGHDRTLPALLETRFPAVGPGTVWIIFSAVLAGLAVKVPLFPLHTWLPSAYEQAPTNVTMMLTGLLSKMGIYGFLRILLPIFPAQIQAALSPLLWLAVATIVLSALAALAQTDLKRIFAYSSINHLGYCLLGLFAACAAAGPAADRSAALGGVLLQVFNHGTIASALFAFVALLEARADGRRGLADFGGLRARLPVFAALMAVALFASLGLPGLSGFVGEFLIFKGAFRLAPLPTAVAVLGLLFTAVVFLRIQRCVFHGPLDPRVANLPDLDTRERLILAPILLLILALGLWPRLLLDLFQSDLMRLVRHLSF